MTADIQADVRELTAKITAVDEGLVHAHARMRLLDNAEALRWQAISMTTLQWTRSALSTKLEVSREQLKALSTVSSLVST